MNLFSQSKLTLKLKKQKNTSSPDLTNKCEKPEIIDFLKTDFTSDNSILSENDSFVEVLHSVQSNKEKLTTSPSVFKTTLSDQNTSNIINENKQCPVCLQMIDVKKFIIHIKSCGTSHNLSSKVLIEAVDLQERQTAEREALGLPILTKNLDVKKKKKCKVNKQTKLKIGSDSNLDLAIAMSVSLQESKNAEIIKESETLLEAGLEKEALEKRKTLENFGFISNQPIKSKSKSCSKTNSLLFKQTKEDREKRITEKVAMILIDVDTSASSLELLVNDCPNTKLVSKYLNTIRNTDNTLWQKSLLEEENMCEFYVKQLSKFIKPCESNNSCSLKNDFKFLTHQKNTLKHESIMNNEEFFDKLQTAVDSSNNDNISASYHNIVRNKTILEYSSKWKSMIGNQLMSDLIIYAKDESQIPAHSLVFYVQCPDILDDVVTVESDTCKSKKMLMWSEYSHEACLAFLELIYSGQESIVKPEFRKDYLLLGTRYHVLIAVNDDEKHGWFSKNADKLPKRKNSEFYNSLNDCKRYKSSSPDMFMSDDLCAETYSSANFLGTTVDDEKSLSVLKTKHWLYSQHHKSSFTENLIISIPPLQINKPEKSPSHSFHSATTVSLKFTSSNSDSENNDEQIKSSPDVNISLLKPILIEDSSGKSVSKFQDIKNVDDILITPVPKMSKLTEYKEPDLITINSDSENGSIDMIFCHDLTKSDHNKTFLSQLSVKNEKINHSFNSSDAKFGNYINTIELNDNSLDSVHSASTNILYQNNYNSKSIYPSIEDSILNFNDKSISIDDGSSMYSAITNVLPINNISTQIFSSNNNVIDLIEDSSDSLYTIDMTPKNNSVISDPKSLNNVQQNSQSYPTSFSAVTSSIETVSVTQLDSTTQHETCSLSSLNSNLLSFSKSGKISFTKSNKEISDNFDINSSSSLDISISPNNKDDSKLSESQTRTLQMDNLSFSNTTSYLKMNCIEDNDKSNNRIFSNENQSVGKCNSDSELLKNILTTSLILPNNNYDDSYVNKIEVDSTSLPSSDCINKHLIDTASPQVEPNQLSEITVPNENDCELNKSNIEQIIDDPWMEYDDWQALNFSPQHVSPALSKGTSLVLEDDSEVQTPREKNLTLVHLLTPPSISSPSHINFSKKTSLTPNKYSNKISTPKSLRRVQSESVIGSKQQVTPLPDYSCMKTPDLRKEFDRYGLKDLGRRKGKLILRHIYDVLHPLFPSEEDNCDTEFERYSSSSDISEHGIPDYEDGSYDDIESFNPINLSNKISVESGFKQLLRTNEDLHKKILCYEPIWIEELKEDLKQLDVNISMQKLMTFLDDKCVTFRSKSLNDQRQKTLSKRSSKRKKLF